ncbi:MAG: DEAD/DEAH box helicase family protein [Bacteroidaceae bacterium]|nr:DEAD/DEAH box helicase family protein [Bacteroidaceae bacterium]
MRNFDYIKDLGLDDLHRFCAAAEEHQLSDPETSAFNGRRAMEYLVRALFEMKNIEVGERTSLFELVDSEDFRNFIGDDRVMMGVHYIRKVGNNAAHAQKVTRKEAFFSLLNLYNLVGAVLLKLRMVSEVRPFDNALIPNSAQRPVLVPNVVKVSKDDALVVAADKEAVASPAPVAALPMDISEAETRRLYIDLMLKEAGWEVLDTEGSIQPLKACVEVKVQGMPNAQGEGFADYVLFGANGKPLAVIEAKRTSVSPMKGKHQAELYADCLERQYGVRPVIYYSNGFETYIIDGMGYPPRRLYGFHTAGDLEWMMQQRKRQDICDFSVQDHITDRAYQKMAIKAVCEHLNKKHRRGLLVMATGTGKTRVSISMVDVLMRNGWVKNVLFLADRISLVNQAHKNFVKLLPNATTCVLSEDGDKDMQARITFSTYQTIINYIDTDEKLFSVGRFDLIIIDEAHRSIFGKYGAIFNYFDGLLVGLTATPRNEVEKSTYDVFEMEHGFPNFAYELEDAVGEGYLVNYKGLKRGSMILKEGIKYSQLTAEEKEQMEKIWEYEETVRDISGNEIFSYIYNEDTIDAVLQDLMNNGLKVQYGERIGKSIIFAYNHRHAEMVVKRFNVLYPEYGSDFCVLIDNTVTYAQDLINKFEVRDGNPQIAVSVDMLDTGIDVPDVLNLVFFKPVKSKIKFMQMIGRGTRLSPNIFGEGADKECFYIFDWCRNFEYFENNPDGQIGSASISLTEKIFGLRAQLAFYLQHPDHQEDANEKTYHDALKQELKEQVKALSDSHITVRSKWETVSYFKKDESWLSLSETDVQQLQDDIAPLLPKNAMDAGAKMFDALLLTIQLALICPEVKADKKVARVQHIAEVLHNEKSTLPQVQAKLSLIKEVMTTATWDKANLKWLEKVRIELRDLMQFLKTTGRWFIIDVKDVISDEGEVAGVMPKVTYRQRVIDFLSSHRNLPVLQKINRLEQLTDKDIDELERILWKELGSKEEYATLTIGQPFANNVGAFIRSLVKVDWQVARDKFSEFISNNELNSEQEDFLKTIVQYVSENGDITKDIVVNEEPFCDHISSFSTYIVELAGYIDQIHYAVVPKTTKSGYDLTGNARVLGMVAEDAERYG